MCIEIINVFGCYLSIASFNFQCFHPIFNTNLSRTFMYVELHISFFKVPHCTVYSKKFYVFILKRIRWKHNSTYEFCSINWKRIIQFDRNKISKIWIILIYHSLSNLILKPNHHFPSLHILLALFWIECIVEKNVVPLFKRKPRNLLNYESKFSLIH